MKAIDEMVIFGWGCPKYGLSDNGKEFINKTVSESLTEYGVKITSTPIYYGLANPIERVNKNLKTMISIFIIEDQRDWDKLLHEFVFVYHTAKHSILKVSLRFFLIVTVSLNS